MLCHFSVRDLTWEKSLDSITLTVITDVPRHLFMRWTLEPPRTQQRSSVRRGLALKKDVSFCFVAYHDNEQEEDGDTLTHTFIKPDWAVCETRHFYFWGYSGELVCESTSPLFALHNDFVALPDIPVPPPGEMLFFPYLSNPSPGRLYITLNNPAKNFSTIYRSNDRGSNWEAVLDSNMFGGVNHRPWMLTESDAGYLCLVYHHHEFPRYFQLYQSMELAGPWIVRLGGVGKAGIWRAHPYIHVAANGADCWCSGTLGPYSTTTILHYSPTGGIWWPKAFNITLKPLPCMIKVNDAGNWAILCGVGALATWQCRRSENPKATPGLWPFLGIAARCARVGYVHPYVVLPYSEYYMYSTDGGHNFIQKAIPVDMETVSTQHWYNGIDESDLHSARILAAPSAGGKGVWVSYDWGDSWEKTLSNLGAPAAPFMNGVWWDKYDDTVCYAWGKLGFFRSNDAGLTWTQRNNGLLIPP